MDLGLPVQVLGGLVPDEIPDIVNQGIIASITDLETAQRLNEEAGKQNRKAECHFLIDTGMGRLGILFPDAEAVIEADGYPLTY